MITLLRSLLLRWRAEAKRARLHSAQAIRGRMKQRYADMAQVMDVRADELEAIINKETK